jgi:hypothetical protein
MRHMRFCDRLSERSWIGCGLEGLLVRGHYAVQLFSVREVVTEPKADARSPVVERGGDIDSVVHVVPETFITERVLPDHERPDVRGNVHSVIIYTTRALPCETEPGDGVVDAHVGDVVVDGIGGIDRPVRGIVVVVSHLSGASHCGQL